MEKVLWMHAHLVNACKKINFVLSSAILEHDLKAKQQGDASSSFAATVSTPTTVGSSSTIVSAAD